MMETVDLLKQLEINYKLIFNDLEFASHEVDSRMAAAARADVKIPDLHALQSRIRALQTATPTLAAEVAQVVQQRQEAEPALNAAVLENYNVMVGLYARLGVAPDPDWVAVAGDIRNLMPAPRENDATDGGRKECRRDRGQAADETGHKDAGEMGASRVEEETRRPSSGVIFEEDFLAVASSTRGRCKLEDVRKVYSKVREDYEDKISRGRPRCKPDPITKQELDAAGLKVFGLTGDSILNTLRSLGLVKVTRSSVTIART